MRPAITYPKEIEMIALDRSGPCTPIHLVLPLLGTSVGFLALMAVLASSSLGLI
jgi:hypothetical protein